ncbi:MAG: ComF family protein [Chloroflexi bacterium]|nr:ComF family protein [Chloroflexota bacterium]
MNPPEQPGAGQVKAEEESRPLSFIGQGLALFKDIGKGLLEILFPTRCAGCSDFKPEIFCDDCINSLEPVPGHGCIICGRPQAEGICYDCKRQAPFFHRADSVYIYCGAIRNALLAWKYRSVESLGPVMTALLIEGVKKNEISLAGIDLILPVPLHEKRVKERGFNQAEVLAAAVSEEFKIPIKTNHLKRVRATALQSKLNKEQRINNVRGAFSLLWAGKLRGKSVLLVDDIMTTGSTLNECARLLRNAGARQVSALTLCRDIPGSDEDKASEN